MTFSVIIPTHNRASQLETAIASVLEQQETNFEILVINDNSAQDYTGLKNKIVQNKKIYYYEVDFGNRSKARNFGIDKAHGKYICFLDDDDIYYDNHLASFVEGLKEKPQSKFLHSYSVVRYENNELVQDKICQTSTKGPNRIIEEPFTINSVCILAELIKKEKFNENLHYWEDKELWIRLSLLADIYSLPIYTNEYIFHGNNTVNFGDLESMENRLEAMEYIRKKYPTLNKNWLNKQLKDQYANLYNLYLGANKAKKAVKIYFKMIGKFPAVIFRRQTLSSIKSLGIYLIKN